MRSVGVVGASLAGTQAAQALRRGGFDGPITMIGDEPRLPYDRPPLSKSFLAGSTEIDKLTLRPASDPDILGVEWRLGTRAVGLELADPEVGGATVNTDSGEALCFDGVIIATGTRARALPGHNQTGGVHLLRSLDDGVNLRRALMAKPERVVVVGCGFIGTEVAATAREMGLEVTMIDTAPAPLARVLDHGAGQAVADLHRAHGVDVRLNVGLSEVIVDPVGDVESVVLGDGTSVDTTVLVVGIGAAVNTEWLNSSTLELDDGVVTDEFCSAAPGVMAAGDVARWKHQRFGGRMTRVEQWDNGVEMGGHAARNLLAWSQGNPMAVYDPVPWFWSDQYDRKIQLAGISSQRSELVQGEVADRQFVTAYLDDSGQPVGVLTWNRPRQAVIGRRLIGEGADLGTLKSELG